MAVLGTTLLPCLALSLCGGSFPSFQPSPIQYHSRAIPTGTPDDKDAPHPEEIVVRGERRGEAKVAAETEFNEDEIASQGSDSINDLIDRLAPLIGDKPEDFIILVNGRPTGHDKSFLGYPTEALNRLAVLKSEAASIYGEPVGKPVINLVLKPHFTMWNADASLQFPTAGGQWDTRLSANRTAISGDLRMHAQGQIGLDTGLKMSDRKIPKLAGIYDRYGLITALDGQEIDPALSGYFGEAITSISLPTFDLPHTPSILDFVDEAQISSPLNPNAYKTLLPSSRYLNFSVGATRPFGDFTASVNLNLSHLKSESQHGIPMISMLIPVGNSLSPFQKDVIITRPFAGSRALQSVNETTLVNASLSVNGKIGRWQTNLALNVSQNWTSHFIETDFDLQRVQQLINDDNGGFNPYGLWSDDFLITNSSKTKTTSLGMLAKFGRPLFSLPAGPINWSLNINSMQNFTEIHQGDRFDNGLIQSKFRRSHTIGQTSLSLPISRPQEGPLSFMGDLNIDVSATKQMMTGSASQSGYSINGRWAPFPSIQFIGSYDYSNAAPSFAHLDAPIVSAPTRIYDHLQGSISEPIVITGGNSQLRSGHRKNISFSANLRPLGNEKVTLNIRYNQMVSENSVTQFPELTPAIEAAFPERIERDEQGNLTFMDARPINLAYTRDTDLATTLTYRKGARSTPQRRTTIDTQSRNSRPLQFSLSVTHRWRLRSDLMIHPWVPTINQMELNGQSKHAVSLLANISQKGYGLTLNGNWSSKASIPADGDFKGSIIKPPLKLDIALFAEPDKLSRSNEGLNWLSGFKISIDIQNITNSYRKVANWDGSLLPGNSRSEIDPIGRTIKVSLRKKF